LLSVIELVILVKTPLNRYLIPSSEH